MAASSPAPVPRLVVEVEDVSGAWASVEQARAGRAKRLAPALACGNRVWGGEGRRGGVALVPHGSGRPCAMLAPIGRRGAEHPGAAPRRADAARHARPRPHQALAARLPLRGVTLTNKFGNPVEVAELHCRRVGAGRA